MKHPRHIVANATALREVDGSADACGIKEPIGNAGAGACICVDSYFRSIWIRSVCAGRSST